MDSSTDTDSEASPQGSDTSNLGCVSSAAESGALLRSMSLSFKSVGKHARYSLFLDPYDGSSEDSDKFNTEASVISRAKRQQRKYGGGGHRRRRRSVFHQPDSSASSDPVKNGTRDSFMDDRPTIYRGTSDLQMCDSEQWEYFSEKDNCGNIAGEAATVPTNCGKNLNVERHLDELILHQTRSSTSGFESHVEGGSFQMLNSFSERSLSSSNLRSLSKRKVVLGTEMDPESRKKPCMSNMEN